MKNPKSDFQYISHQNLLELREVKEGKLGFGPQVIGLMRRKLVEYDMFDQRIKPVRGPHHRELKYHYSQVFTGTKVKLTHRGELALLGIFVGSTVRVTESCKHTHLHGEVGTVTNIHDSYLDSDGADEYGFIIKRTSSTFTVDVKLDNNPTSINCFYKYNDLEAIYISQQTQTGYYCDYYTAL